MAKITAVKFNKKDLAIGYKQRAVVTLDDGTSEEAFAYYPDELTFHEVELIGLTVREAYLLFVAKDKEYIRKG